MPISTRYIYYKEVLNFKFGPLRLLQVPCEPQGSECDSKYILFTLKTYQTNSNHWHFVIQPQELQLILRRTVGRTQDGHIDMEVEITIGIIKCLF